MSNPVVRIATVNILLACLFALLVYLELPYFPFAAGVLAAVAILTNAVMLMRRGPEPTGHRPETRPVVPPVPQEPTASLGRVRPATDAERRPPKPANRHDEAAVGEMPPWLRMKGNIVMTWNGKHHVAPINGDDPFEVAQRLYERLRRGGDSAAEPADAHDEAGKQGNAGVR